MNHLIKFSIAVSILMLSAAMSLPKLVDCYMVWFGNVK